MQSQFHKAHAETQALVGIASHNDEAPVLFAVDVYSKEGAHRHDERSH